MRSAPCPRAGLRRPIENRPRLLTADLNQQLHDLYLDALIHPLEQGLQAGNGAGTELHEETASVSNLDPVAESGAQHTGRPLRLELEQKE